MLQIAVLILPCAANRGPLFRLNFAKLSQIRILNVNRSFNLYTPPKDTARLSSKNKGSPRTLLRSNVGGRKVNRRYRHQVAAQGSVHAA